jgi:hypothetical protein
MACHGAALYTGGQVLRHPMTIKSIFRYLKKKKKKKKDTAQNLV